MWAILLVPNFTHNVTIYARVEEPPQKPTDVVGLISYYSKQYGIDERIPLEVARAESNYKNVPNFKYDGEKGRYTAYGIFQFTRTTWKGFCTPDPTDRMDIEKNIECGVRMLSEGRISHWSESRSMWVTKLSGVIE